MHQAQTYFDGSILPVGFTQPWITLVINPAQAANLQAKLYKDAWSYLFSAAVSIGDALKGVDGELFSWATVKLYYAAFYSLRAHLAASSYAILYQKTQKGGTPFSLHSFSGESPKKLAGNTHKVVLSEYDRIFPSSIIVTQQIDGGRPLDWMINRREEANYKNGCFPEPIKPNHFLGVTSKSSRLTLAAYIADDGLTLGFDHEHSILSLPILAFRKAKAELEVVNPGGAFTQIQSDFLKNLFRDKHGELTVATAIFS